MFNEEKKYIVIPKDSIIEWETRNDGITKITFHPTSATIDAKNSIARFHDDAIDSLKYFTTKAISENSKGGIEKDMKILNIYEDYQIIKIKEKTKKEIQKIEENSPEYKIIKKYEEKMKQELGKIYEEEFIKEKINSNIIYSQKTLRQKEEIYKIEEKQRIELDMKLQEIKSLLELAENYEQKVEILKAYKVINKNGTINTGEDK